MQMDMHYYGTYALARAAGLNAEAAKIVATAAQFVDDNADEIYVCTREGSGVLSRATAHHMLDKANIEPKDQRNVWLPFHFLPGNEGTHFEDKLICRKDSALARQMLTHHLSCADKRYALELVGITAHVYADTFAHYGFSGISSERNMIRQEAIQLDVQDPNVCEYLTSKASTFWSNVQYCLDVTAAAIAETCSGALGHGAAATFPDRPFLRWEMEYRYPGMGTAKRDNQRSFLEACEKLHAFFQAFAQKRPDIAVQGKSFEAIRPIVEEVIATEGDKEARIRAWCSAMEKGDFGPQESIPPYEGDGVWLGQLEQIREMKDSSGFLDLPVYQFLIASSMHRHWVLRELLPEHSLMVA